MPPVTLARKRGVLAVSNWTISSVVFLINSSHTVTVLKCKFYEKLATYELSILRKKRLKIDLLQKTN